MTIGLDRCERCERWSSLVRLYHHRRNHRTPWERAKSFRSCPRCLGGDAWSVITSGLARPSTTCGCPLPTV